jgi:hypothetical protein
MSAAAPRRSPRRNSAGPKEATMSPAAPPALDVLLERLDIRLPVLGLYDAPDPAPFAPLVGPKAGARTCLWAFYEQWMRGKTAHLTKERSGCGGFARAYFEVESRSREEFLAFLVDDEGLRASRELMAGWVDSGTVYRRSNDHILVGPWRPGCYEHLVTATFLVDPDQLSALVIGANYHAAAGDPTPVLAPFGSGCMELCVPFRDAGVAQATIGATDLAMRKYVPREILAFTVTRPMLERLCALDERSFLYKAFLGDLKKARARGAGTGRP